MQLTILTPSGAIFNGEADSVTLPGTQGLFTVLDNHAPMLSSLRKGGTITYGKGKESASVGIEGGFVRVLDNAVTVCVETQMENEQGE